MNAYYIQKAQEIFPIYGVNSLEEAQEIFPSEDHVYIVETDEDVYMNLATGSVDFKAGWGDYLDDVVLVKYDAESESWIED